MNFRKMMMAVLLPALTAGATQAQNVEYFKNFKPITGLSGLGRSLTRTLDGNMLVTGTHYIPGFGETLFVTKTTFAGDTLWFRHYGQGGQDWEGYNITQLSSGSILIAGSVKDTAANASESALLLQLSNTGGVQWTKNFGKAGHSIVAHDLKVLNDGYAFCGTIIDTANGMADAWMAKSSLNGDTLWTKTYGGIDYDDAWQIEKTPDGGFLLAGGSYSYRSGNAEDDAWMVKTNATGDMQWLKNYGTADKQDWIWSIAPAVTDGTLTGYVFTGVKNFNGTQSSSMLIGKVDTLGNLLWDKSMDGAFGFRQGFCIEPTGDNGYYLAATEFDPTKGFQLLTIKIDKNGETVNTLLHGNQEAITPRGMYINNLSDAFITGERLTPASGSGSFLTRIREINKDGTPTAIPAIEETAQQIAVYPNPAATYTMISSKEPITQLRLSDVSGRTLLQRNGNNTYTQTLSLGNVPEGIYLLYVTTHQKGNASPATSVLRLTIQ